MIKIISNLSIKVIHSNIDAIIFCLISTFTLGSLSMIDVKTLAFGLKQDYNFYKVLCKTVITYEM